MKFRQSEIGADLTRFRDGAGDSPNLDGYLEQSVVDTDVLRTKVNKRMAQMEELLRVVSEIEKKYGKTNGNP